MSIGRFAATLGMVAFLALASVSDAAADPITFTYRVDINQRCLVSECAPFSASFPLVLSFDSAVTLAIDEPNIVRGYGFPTFSTIPLDRPDVFPGATEFGETTDIAVLPPPPGNEGRVASASRTSQFLTEDIDYRWNLLFIRGESLPAVPLLSPSSFGSFLNGGTFLYVFVGINRHNPEEFTKDSISYQGTAALVPEPASLLLVGTGLCGLAARAWRRKRSRTS